MPNQINKKVKLLQIVLDLFKRMIKANSGKAKKCLLEAMPITRKIGKEQISRSKESKVTNRK
jgi:hypothetical protein